MRGGGEGRQPVEENTQFLKAVSLFEELPEAALKQISGKTLELAFAKGRTIFKENDKGDALFVIKSGIVQIYIGDGAEKKVFTYLKRGDYFGEMAIFTGDPRSASADAIADVVLLGLRKQDFEEEVKRSPELALELIKTLSRRLAGANTRTGSTDNSGKIIYLTGSEKEAGKSVLARDLARSLQEVSGARVCLVDPNVQNPSLAQALGIEDDCDLAKELVSSDSVTVERYCKETSWGFHLLLPPQFNRHMMQEAERLLVVLSGKQDSIESFLQPFENLVVGAGNVDRRKIRYMFNCNAGPEDDPRSRVGAEGPELSLVLPHDPEALAAATDAKSPTPEVRPQSEWSQAVNQLARDVHRNHSLQVVIPLRDEEEKGREEGASLSRELEELFQDEPVRRDVTPWDDADPASGTGLSIEVRATDKLFTEGMDSFLQQSASLRDRMGLEQILIRVDGRPSLI
jgi:CRP-like cAMP-binding protein